VPRTHGERAAAGCDAGDVQLSPRPPDDAYGRVTDPERYRVVVDAALATIDELRARPGVSVRRVDESPFGGGLAPDLIVRIDADGAPSPTWVGITPFPGVYVQAGDSRFAGYPSCGCDACDEDPDELARQVAEEVAAVTRR
jgi:hypothetical protein